MAGIDVELPTGDAYLQPLADPRPCRGASTRRSSTVPSCAPSAQKEELGLLDPAAFEDGPPTDRPPRPSTAPELARRLAQESVVLLSNSGVLPLNGWSSRPARVAVVGPNADRAPGPPGLLLVRQPRAGAPPRACRSASRSPTVVDAFGAAFDRVGAGASGGGRRRGLHRRGGGHVGVRRGRRTPPGGADVAVVVVGDQAGLFGRGTVGEGNDSESLDPPGGPARARRGLVATGTPVVMVLLTGRPYAIGWALDGAGPRPGAVLQAFFPGEGGGAAIAGIVTGAVNPSGRLPVSMPRSAGAQPYSYLHPGSVGRPT